MPLYTDREKLRQIILNLLDNAVKFTDHGEIRISACQENGHFKFAVADTGIGITKCDIKGSSRNLTVGDWEQRKVSWHRARARYREKACGSFGRILTAESEVGKGSLFTVILPVKRQENISG